jgi:hypothetical protein
VLKKALQLPERFHTLREGIGMLQRLVAEDLFTLELLEKLEAFSEIPDVADSRKVEQIFAQPLVSWDSWGRGSSFAGAGKSL